MLIMPCYVKVYAKSNAVNAVQRKRKQKTGKKEIL